MILTSAPIEDHLMSLGTKGATIDELVGIHIRISFSGLNILKSKVLAVI